MLSSRRIRRWTISKEVTIVYPLYKANKCKITQQQQQPILEKTSWKLILREIWEDPVNQEFLLITLLEHLEWLIPWCYLFLVILLFTWRSQQNKLNTLFCCFWDSLDGELGTSVELSEPTSIWCFLVGCTRAAYLLICLHDIGYLFLCFYLLCTW